MNAHTPLKAPATPLSMAADMAVLSRKAALCRRARLIAERVIGEIPAAHGFNDPLGFVAACRLSASRNRLSRELARRYLARDARKPAAFEAAHADDDPDADFWREADRLYDERRAS